MRKEKMYTQCKLKKGSDIQYAWIPSEFAIQDKFIKLKDNNGWQVIEIGITDTEKHVRENERNYIIHRKATDV